MANSLYDKVIEALQQAEKHNSSIMVKPEVILWPDPEKQWTKVIPVLQKDFPQIKIIENRPNNYTKALNLGIRNSNGSCIIILNNDTVVDKNYFTGLLDVAQQDPQIGAVQSKILFDDHQTINSVGVEEIEDCYFHDIGFCQKDTNQFQEKTSLQYFSGGSVMLKRQCIQDVGDFDEDFMFYMEDVDYSIRCRKNNWKICYSPKSVLCHNFHGTASQEFCDYFCSRNRLLLIAKHFPEKLPESIKTSHFYLKDEFENLYHSLIQAVAKMLEHNNLQTCQKVLKDLKHLGADVFARCRDREFIDSKLAGFQADINTKLQPYTPPSAKDKIKKIPLIGLISVKANECFKTIKKLLCKDAEAE